MRQSPSSPGPSYAVFPRQRWACPLQLLSAMAMSGCPREPVVGESSPAYAETVPSTVEGWRSHRSPLRSSSGKPEVTQPSNEVAHTSEWQGPSTGQPPPLLAEEQAPLPTGASDGLVLAFHGLFPDCFVHRAPDKVDVGSCWWPWGVFLFVYFCPSSPKECAVFISAPHSVLFGSLA